MIDFKNIIAIIFLISSVVFYGFSLKKKKITLRQPIYYLFIAFMCLYNIIPAISYILFPRIGSFMFSLSSNKELVIKQLFISGFCIYIFSVLMLTSKIQNTIIIKKNYYYLNPVIIYFILFPISIYFSYKYPWPSMGQQLQVGNSISAHLKNILTILFLIISINYERKWKILTFFMFVVIAVIDTQRTNLFIVTIMFIMQEPNLKLIKKYVIIGISLLIIIGITRNGKAISVINIFYPFIMEGLLGSYGFLQAIFIANHNIDLGKQLILIFSPLNDITTHYLGTIFSIYGISTEKLLTVTTYMGNLAKTGILHEPFFPMGGFFFLAEYHLMIPYLGPIIFIFILFKYIKYIENLKSIYIKNLLYSTIFLFIKASFINAFKHILVLLILYIAFYLLNSFLKTTLKNQKENTVIENIN